MTPTFYTIFDIFKKTINAFNQKCNCKGIYANVSFEQTLGTKNTNDNTSLWIAKFESDTFESQRFGGTIDRVSELVGTFLSHLSKSTLEACMANADEWYKDKPEVKEEVYFLYNKLVELNQNE